MATHLIHDKALLRRRQARAIRSAATGADFLLARCVADLAERLAAVERRFATGVALFGATRSLADMLAASRKVEEVFRLERASEALADGAYPGAVGDEEALPFGDASVDLVVSALALHWANDLPGALAQIRRALKPDGLFLAALLGGDTLTELRQSLAFAETDLRGGLSPRVTPFADVRDIGNLLQRAGFALPVADRDVLVVRYATPFDLLRDLRGMGGANALSARERRPAMRALFARMAEVYAERFADADGRVRASFEIVSVSGWAPHESQQRPARRGSGNVSLARVLGGTEDGG